MRTRVAIIGAGIAGLVCARELVAAGQDVTVLDRGRVPGGRLATHRLPLVAFDHGAQYVTAREPAFADYLDLAMNAGVVAAWCPRVLAPGTGPTADAPWLVGVPGMGALARPLATGLAIRQQVRIAGLERTGRRWSLLSVSGDVLEPFDTLVLAVPAAQAADLCEDFPGIVAQLVDVQMTPCWAAMLAFGDATPVAWDVAVPRGSPLAWVARNSSKPGRATDRETWVVHATPEFSQAHLDASESAAGALLVAAFGEVTGLERAPQLVLTHRWRHARVAVPLGAACVWDAELQLGLCGDWCLDARVEAAWISARALARCVAGG